MLNPDRGLVMGPGLMNKLAAEFIGTLFLCSIALLSRNPLAIGFTLAALMYGLGYISGGHFNPAISLAVWLRGKMGREEMLRYMAAQLAGGLAACAVFKLLQPGPANPWAGVPSDISGLLPVSTLSTTAVLAGEFGFTFLLVSTFLHVTTASQQSGNAFFGAATGICVFAGTKAMGSSAGAFNPVLGLDLVMVGGQQFWMIPVYGITGAAAAAAAATVFRLLNPHD